MFKSDSGSYIAAKNSFVNIPKSGIAHGFKNLSDKPAKLLWTVTPAGLGDLFEKMANYFEKDVVNPENETKEKINSLFERYGQKIYPENYF